VALISPSALIESIRGKVGGTVFGNTQAGPIARMRVIPRNPKSDRQRQVRSILSAAPAAWAALDPNVRSAWDAYAADTPVPSRMGGTIQVSGFDMFVRDYCLRAIAGMSALTSAPSTPGLAASPNLTSLTFTHNSGQISVAFGSPWWKSVTGTALFLRVHAPQRVTRNTSQTPPRIVCVCKGSSGSPPSSPQTPDCPWGTIGAAGSAEYYTEAVCIDQTGRLSVVQAFRNDIA